MAATVPSRPASMMPRVDRARRAKQRTENEIEFSRIVAFSDGVFAIAITLLVLPLQLSPDLANGNVADALFDQRDNFLAFAISFAVIGRFWLVHHRFFGEVTAFDGRLIGLNMRLPRVHRADPVQQRGAGRVRRRDGGGRPVLDQPRPRRHARLADGRRRAPRRAHLDRPRAPNAKPASAPPTSPPSSCSRSRSPSSTRTSRPYLWLALFFDPAGSRGGGMTAGRT